jgi:DNA-binding CsgD family transcriptional regulator/DNA-binding MarR family transcriptional regulator
MDEAAFDLREPGVLEAICDDSAMRCWQRLRVRETPLAAAVVAKEVGVELQEAHAALDLLESAKLVRKLPAAGKRRVVAYEVTTKAIFVVARTDDEEAKRSFQALIALGRRREELILTRAKSFEQRVQNEWFFSHVTELVATPEEIKELQRRIYEASRFALELAERTRSLEAPVEGQPRHAVHLRVVPLVGAPAPFPAIRMLTPQAIEDQNRSKGPSPQTLGARERAVAKLLQDGLTRGEVAAKLGISEQTVGTYCKRLFSKLGISRAIELNRFYFGVTPEPKPRRVKEKAAE